MQTSTPKADGFWMPGEHSPLSSVWLAWPTRPDNWREQAVHQGRQHLLTLSSVSATTSR